MTSTTLAELTPSIDVGQADAHLRALHGDAGGYVSLVLMRDRRVTCAFARAPELLWRDLVPRDGAADALQDTCAARWQVYLACADFLDVPERGRGTARDVRSLPGVWADLDVKPGVEGCFGSEAEVREYLATLPEPSLLVATGSGGLHAYWLTTARLDANEGRALLNHWREYLLSLAGGRELDPVQETARVLRLAGTLRWPKAGELGTRPAPVVLERADGPRYYPGQLWTISDPAFQAARARRLERDELARRVGAARDELLAGLGAGDVAHHRYLELVTNFNAREDWARLLLADHWTLFSDDRDRAAACRYWTRPGKDPRDGKSAATDYTTVERGVSAVLSLYTAEPSLAELHEHVNEAGRVTCSKWHFARLRLFGGDEAALLAAVRAGGGVLPR